MPRFITQDDGHAMILRSTLVIISAFFLVSLMACDAENNPTTMKGRTITPARLPKIHPDRSSEPLFYPCPAPAQPRLTGEGRRYSCHRT